MVTVGIVGASGFVGLRAVEMLYQQGMIVRPVVRHSDRLAIFSKMKLEGYVANGFDEGTLSKAFRGCDVVIHTVLGNPGLIRGSVTPAYRAAQKAGVRRLIYLSSMIVHTSAPAPGTTESSPPIKHQPRFPTHIAKIDAEQRLLRLRKKGSVEVVIFRPGIVFGPRSRWVTELAEQLKQGTAYLINEGQGICNTVYIDNLIHAIKLAMFAEGADGEAFFVGDRELITWLNFYSTFADALNIDLTKVARVTAPEFTNSWEQQTIDSIRNSEISQQIISLLPEEFKQKIKHNIFCQHQKLSKQIINQNQINITEMMTILQKSQYKLPYTKAKKILGYDPIFSFSEGCTHSIDWLNRKIF